MVIPELALPTVTIPKSSTTESLYSGRAGGEYVWQETCGRARSWASVRPSHRAALGGAGLCLWALLRPAVGFLGGKETLKLAWQPQWLLLVFLRPLGLC